MMSRCVPCHGRDEFRYISQECKHTCCYMEKHTYIIYIYIDLQLSLYVASLSSCLLSLDYLTVRRSIYTFDISDCLLYIYIQTYIYIYRTLVSRRSACIHILYIYSNCVNT